VLAFKDTGAAISQYVNLKFVVIMSFIAAVCYVWRQTLLHYERLFRAKFDILKQLEKLGLYTVYAAEGVRLDELREKKTVPRAGATETLPTPPAGAGAARPRGSRASSKVKRGYRWG